MKNIFKKLKTFWWRVKSVVAIYYYGNPSKKLKIVGVTGTNGKTTTATLLYRVATSLGHKSGLISTVENIIGEEVISTTHTTPDSVTLTKLFYKMVEAGCEYAFMEVSSHALDQHRVYGVNFTGAIFSNLTHDHLDYHKSIENYFLAKKKLFQMLPASSFALSNVDDEHGMMMLEGIVAQKYTYGFKHPADFNEKLETQLLGDFNAYNILAIYAASLLLGFDKPERPDDSGRSGGDKVKEILKNIKPPKGRFEYFKSKNGVTAIVDYAHTPDALQNVLNTIKKMQKENVKIISVFGCGGDRDPLKRRIMGKIGVELSDIAIITSDNPRSEDPDKIIAEMKTDISMPELEKVKTFTNRHEAILEGVKLAVAGDFLLVAGKGHEDYQEIKGVKYHFDDMEELKKAFGEK